MKYLSFLSFVLSIALLMGFSACEPTVPENPSVDSGGASSDSTSLDNGSGNTGTDTTNPNDDMAKSGYVDLGLSVKWSAVNVGADFPEDYGEFYEFEEAVSEFGNNLPTKAHYEELIKKCAWEWTTYNGVYGRRFLGANGNSVFFPAAGGRFCDGTLYIEGTYGGYWSSTAYASNTAWRLIFNPERLDVDKGNRCDAQSVRLIRIE